MRALLFSSVHPSYDSLTENIFVIYTHLLTINLPTTTIVAQPFNIIEWQLKFNPVA